MTSRAATASRDLSGAGGAEHVDRASRLRIAYLVGRYPVVSHTFILREVLGLRTAGVDVTTFSIWRSHPDQVLSAAATAEWKGTFWLLPPRLSSWAPALGRGFLRHPLRAMRLLHRSQALASPGIRGRALALLWAMEALVLWRECRRRDLRHVHVHLSGTAPTVALLMVEFANAVGRGSPAWSWSMTVHGPTEFFDVVRERLTEKVAAANFVICISDFARSQLMSRVDAAEWPKLRVVHCGIDPSEFASTPRAKDEATDLRVLNVARLVPVKGQAVLLKAVGLLRERGFSVQLVVVGDGPDRDRLRDLSQELGLDGRVRWVGAVGEDAVNEFYADADIFCTTSFAEGIPIVLMEAMASRVPVVATRITGVPELVEDEVSGLLVTPGRVTEAADALQRLIEDPALRDALGKAGRQRVNDEYSLRGSVKQLEEAFRAHLADVPLR